jgi:hypothetical protein
MNKESYKKDHTAFLEGFKLCLIKNRQSFVEASNHLLMKSGSLFEQNSRNEGYKSAELSDETCEDGEKHWEVYRDYDNSEYKKIIKENK